jgi:hypothetical protein
VWALPVGESVRLGSCVHRHAGAEDKVARFPLDVHEYYINYKYYTNKLELSCAKLRLSFSELASTDFILCVQLSLGLSSIH